MKMTRSTDAPISVPVKIKPFIIPPNCPICGGTIHPYHGKDSDIPPNAHSCHCKRRLWRKEGRLEDCASIVFIPYDLDEDRPPVVSW